MMNKIEHHIHALECAPMERMDRNYKKVTGYAKTHLQHLRDEASRWPPSSAPFQAFILGSLNKQPHAEVASYIYDYLQIAMGDYAGYANKLARYQATYRDITVTIEKEEYRQVSFSDWLKAFCACIILRDPFEQIHLLLNFECSDFATFDGSDSTGGDNDIDRVMFRFIRAFFIDNDNVDIRQRIQDVVTYSEPQFVGEDFAQDYVNHLFLPLAELLVSVHRNDFADSYPKKLRQALDLHIQYYTAKGEDRELERESYLSIFITAMASHAFDVRGIVPDIETEYMPLWLVKGEFPSYAELHPEFAHNPPSINTMFRLSATTTDQNVDWHKVVTETIRWAKQQPNLPPVCEVIGRDIQEAEVEKSLAGEIFIDAEGKQPELVIYTLEPSLIANPEAWKNSMKQEWNDFTSKLFNTVNSRIELIEP